MLELVNLSINYSDKELSFLKDVNLQIPTGSISLLLGDSGSGQTTICLAIAGLLKHSRPEANISGVIRWQGNLINQDDFHPEIAITLENPLSQFSGIKRTALEEMAFGLEMRGHIASEIKNRINFTTEIFGISHLLPRSLRTLSGGETQKVIIACSYVLMPKLWILDRPLTELDPLARSNFLQNLKKITEENGTTVIITEESATDLYSIATHLMTIKKGKIGLSLNDNKNNIHSFDSSNFSSKMEFTKTSITPSKADLPSYPYIKVKGLSFQYSSEHPSVFDNINFSVNPGECLWITGPNGCGKTTLAKIIAGILKPQKGEVKINGNNPAFEPIWKVAKYVAYAFQNPDFQIFSTSLWDEVYFGPNNLGYSATICENLTRDTLKCFALDERGRGHPHDLNRSGRKRLGLASTFAMNTPVIILDEPTQFQDAKGKELIKKAIKEALKEGKIVLCITHDMEFVNYFR